MRQAAMSATQREILRNFHSAPGTQHQSLALRLRGVLDEMRLVNALEMLVAREPRLRLTTGREATDIVEHAFEDAYEDGTTRPGDYGLRLIALPSMPLPLECRDLSWLNAADMAEESKSILRHEKRAPFDRYDELGALFRIMLVRYSALHHVLVLTVHPAIASAADVRAMMNNLARLYESICVHGLLPDSPPADRSSPDWLPDISASDISFPGRPAAPQAGRPGPQAGRLEPQSCLAGVRTLSPEAKTNCSEIDEAAAPSLGPLLPADFPRAETPKHAAATHSILLPAEQLARMRRACSASQSSKKLPLDFPVFAAFVLWMQGMMGQQAPVQSRKPDQKPDQKPDGDQTLARGLPEEIVLGVAGAAAALPVRCLALPRDNVTTFMESLRRSMEEACHQAADPDTGDRDTADGDTASRDTNCRSSDLSARLPGNLFAGPPAKQSEGWVRHQFHFDSLDSFEHLAATTTGRQAFRFASLQTELVWNARHSVPADLVYCLRVSGGDTYLHCDYNAALFKRETVSRWSAEVARLLRTMLEEPEQLLSEILWLASAEYHSLLIDLNRTATSYARDSSIQDIFERQVLRTPDAAALVNEEGSLTYAELNEKANQLARFLRRYGIARGERIALMAERSLGSVVGALATLKAGCAYIPIDIPTDAEELPSHILELLEHSRPAAVLTQARFAPLFAHLDAPVVLMDADWPAVATEPMENIALPIAAEAPACVLYRRDAGGRLRGVLLPHRAFVRLVQASNGISFGGGEVFLQLARLSDDAWALEVWGPLLNGGQLAMLPPGWQAPVQIGSAIEHYGATALWLNAVDLHSIVAGHIEAMAPLRQIVTGTISPALLSRLLERYPRVRVVSGFGPAENGTFTCVDKVSLDSLVSLHSREATRPTVGRPIGRPSANTRVYILGRQGELVRLGEPGELHVAGDGLAIGYLHAPELTDEKFFLHAFSSQVQERLFRTGILACYREGGRVEVLGSIEAPTGMDKLESKKNMDKPFKAAGGAEATPLEAGVLEAELEGVGAIESFASD